MIRKYRLPLQTKGYVETIRLPQYDQSYMLVFDIHGLPEGTTDLEDYTAKMEGTRSDGLKYEYTGTISGTSVSFEIDTRMTAAAGNGEARIVFSYASTGEIYASANFQTYIDASPVPDDAADADTEEAREIADEIREIVSTAAAQTTAEAERIVAGLEADVADVKENLNAVFVVDSASGSVAHFTDGADNIPMKSVKVNIEPIQSGSGDPSPTNVRPISGWDSVKVTKMGKNLCAPLADSTGSANGITFTYTDNVIKVSGTTTKANADTPNKYLGGSSPVPIILRAGVTYTASLVGKVEASSSVRLMLKQEGILKLYYNSNNGVWTFTPETTQEISQVSLRFPTSGTVVNIEAKLQIEVGDTATSYEEYGGNVYDVFLTPTGGNLFDINTVFSDTSKFTIEDGTVSGTASDFSNTPYSIPSTLVGKKLKFSVDATLGATPNHVRVSVTVAETAISGEWVEANTSGRSSVIFTPTSTSDVVRVVFGSSGSGIVTLSDVRLEVVNTVYGGVLDVVSGVLTVDRASVVMDGSSDEGWYAMTTANIFRANAFYPTPASGATAEDFENHPIVSNCTNTSRYNYNTMKDAYPCVSFNDQGRLYLAISADTTTIEQALAWLAQNNLQLVYYLAEPQTVQLTATEIKSLLCINNVWSDAGDVECDYRADTKLYINCLTDPDLDMIADSNIVSGQYFMVGNSLFKATANIASGASVIVGTNATRKSLSEALNEINNA